MTAFLQNLLKLIKILNTPSNMVENSSRAILNIFDWTEALEKLLLPVESNVSPFLKNDKIYTDEKA